MTIQEKYKYLYDNYKVDEYGFLSDIIRNCKDKTILEDRDFNKIFNIYNPVTNPGISRGTYIDRDHNNQTILAVELLYSKCKAFEDSKG